MPANSQAQTTSRGENTSAKRVLLIFSEARDLPGNVMMEQSVRAEVLKNATNQVDFYTESLDAVHFPTPKYYRLFRNYIANKYAGRNLDLVLLFMSRDFTLARELPPVLPTNLPALFVVVNQLEIPDLQVTSPCTSVIQRFDVAGTVKFIFQLQPETRHVVVIGGSTVADRALLTQIQETAATVEGVTFEFWNNRPVAEMYEAARRLPADTVILVGTLQRDVTGEPYYTSQVLRTLAPVASVPIYVLGNGLIGTGALGGNVINFEDLGADAGKLASRILAGTPPNQIPVEIKSNGVPMVDWRAMERWQIKPSRLPANCIAQYRPRSLWEDHWRLFLLIAICLFGQAITIAALLVQRKHQQHAEAEIMRQRTELTHVARVSMMGQLASALTHELNQPLGAILRNAEAAEEYLQADNPNLKEVRAILTDIRRDDKRAGNVIDRMRSLFKRQKLTVGTLDLRDLVEDTMAMIRADANARQIKLKVEIQPHLPSAQGDRVHVQQILLNLIFNGMDAMKTAPQSRKSLAVKVSHTRHGNLQVKVRDHGTGVSAEDAPRIFEPFFSTKSNGMGMGLAISKTIIEALGGEIWMESKAAEGTSFTFILPPAGFERVKPGDLPSPL